MRKTVKVKWISDKKGKGSFAGSFLFSGNSRSACATQTEVLSILNFDITMQFIMLSYFSTLNPSVTRVPFRPLFYTYKLSRPDVIGRGRLAVVGDCDAITRAKAVSLAGKPDC